MDKITVTLSLTEWNTVLNALGQRPFVEVAAILNSIQDQAKAQIDNSDKDEQ
jgi:hypothetical protein